MGFCAGPVGKRGFWPQTGCGNHHVHFHAAVAVEGRADPGVGFCQTLQLRFQQLVHAHIRQAML
ncbi:hypothetical protein D3C86_1750920 [compost metagenome]